MSMIPYQQRPSTSPKITTMAFWGFKAFVAMGATTLTGGMDILVGIGTELLVEGICALGRRVQRPSGQGNGSNNGNQITHVHHHTYITNNYNHSNNSNSNNNNAQAVPDRAMYARAIEGMVNSHGSVENFQREITNFGQFSGELSTQLQLHGDREGGEAMATAARLYRQFQDCDLDRSGGVSIEEFIVFCDGMGLSRESAMEKFFRADVNGDGQISFEEWTKMMMGRVGRAESGLNCGGQHGLTQYTARYHGMPCSFCGNAIIAGSVASGCRRCNCDACSSCAGLSQPSPRRPPFEGSSSRALWQPSVRQVNELNCRCSHGLKPITAPAGAYCSWCPTLVRAGSPAVGCRACGVYSCVDCVAVSLEARCASALTCRDRHGLVKRSVKDSSYTCNFCRDVLVIGTALYGCRTCEMAACVMCMFKDHLRVRSSTSGAFSCPGNHELRPMLIYGYQQRVHTCTWCLGTPSLKASILRCHVCDVNVCHTCQAGRLEEANGLAQAGAFGQQASPASASTPGLSPPPPSYGEHVLNYSGHGGAPSPLPRVPLACASGAHPPPRGFGHGGGLYPPAKCVGDVRASSRGFGHARSERVLHVATRQQAIAPDFDFPDEMQPTTLHKASSSPICSEEFRPRPLQNASSPGFSEGRQLALVDTEWPFPFDSVVRVLSKHDDDPLGRLMTVIGFEPSGGCLGEGGGGEVMLNWRGSVEKAETFLVCTLDNIQ